MQGRQNNSVGFWRMKDWAGHLAIAALLIGLIVWVRDDIADLRIQVRAENAALRTEVKADIAALRTEVQADIADLRNQISDLQQRMARVEGLVEGLRPVFAAAEAPPEVSS